MIDGTKYFEGETNMEELQSLYENRSLTELIRVCRSREKAGSADYEFYAYWAWAAAGSNSIHSKPLEDGTQKFQRAAALAQGAQLQELYENFVRELRTSMEEIQSMFGTVAMTLNVVKSYRACMRHSADALSAAVEAGTKAGLDTLPAKKLAVDAMVKLCGVYRYEQQIDKSIMRIVDNVDVETRQKYVPEYDRLVAEIRMTEPDYAPEEIQREHVVEQQSAPEPGDEPQKKGLLATLRDLFS